MTEKVLEDILKEIQKLSERIANIPQYDQSKWNPQSPFQYQPTQSGTAGSIAEITEIKNK
jgi:hypothetical protein